LPDVLFGNKIWNLYENKDTIDVLRTKTPRFDWYTKYKARAWQDHAHKLIRVWPPLGEVAHALCILHVHYFKYAEE
jgi:hypothetical protein